MVFTRSSLRKKQHLGRDAPTGPSSAARAGQGGRRTLLQLRAGLPADRDQLQPCAAATDGAIVQWCTWDTYLELSAGGPQQPALLGANVGARDWRSAAAAAGACKLVRSRD